jgi:hypothetical protein
VSARCSSELAIDSTNMSIILRRGEEETPYGIGVTPLE